MGQEGTGRAGRGPTSLTSFRQHVPRPANGGPALPPPWREAFGAPYRVPVGLVRKALAKLQTPRATTPAEAAVLVALYGDGAGDDGEATAILIRRAAHLGHDPGHVAFPGGLIEPGELPEAAALREAEEEVGLDPASVELLGPLSAVDRPRRRRLVQPFVGVLGRRPTLVPSPAEVEAILEVSLAQLVADGIAWEERWPLPVGGGEAVHVVRFFACECLGEDLIWGVTAKILWDLLERVAAVVR
jgi:8-oxo-dGTP pyrophosphatase MutT (NUDIX family)